MSAEKQILDKFYGRTKRFTNAVDQMKKVLQNLAKEKNKKRRERERKQAKKKDDEQQQQLIERVKRRTIKIILTKLKPAEIEKWTSKPTKSFSMVLRKR